VKNSMLLRAMLGISGLIASGLGGAILLDPASFYAANGVQLGTNVSLLNEVRASGGALLASGLIILSGAFVTRMMFTSALVSSALYLAYGISRLLAMALDGVPARGLVNATVVELVIGLALLFALWRQARRQPITAG